MSQPEVSKADDFLNAWREFERAMSRLLSQYDFGREDPSMDDRIRSLASENIGEITESQVDFLIVCKKVRNILEHSPQGLQMNRLVYVSLDMKQRLERITASLKDQHTVKSIANKAEKCSPESSVRDVLQTMSELDYSQLPYVENGQWFLVTREQVSQWLGAIAEVHEGLEVSLDMGTTVSRMTAHPKVSRIEPARIQKDQDLQVAVNMLEAAVKSGGYPAILVFPNSSTDPAEECSIVTINDLGKAYRILGR